MSGIFHVFRAFTRDRHELVGAKTFIQFLNGIQLTVWGQVGFALFGNKPTFFVSGFA
jgi:hypothetical protein